MSFTIDSSEFNDRMAKLFKARPAIKERIILKTLDAVLVDAITVFPKVPLLEGFLRGTAKSARAPAIEMIDENTGVLAFQQPYAAKLEDPEREPKFPNWSEDDVGKEYAGKKLQMFYEKYGQLLAEFHADELGRL
jgi:hypothetical protein